MFKNSRPFIIENFPFELRVELDLLSRKNITNKEKQDKLFNLLREYKIKNLVALDSGTNRYACELNGFVVKFATDYDGKIDNMKEFKMAKRLSPYVVQVNEISSNCCLMVCEYIQPFDSFQEMLMYKSEIQKILTDLSQNYLIGDVGISEKNFRNWGVRIGTNKPVCLNFADVYDVKSSIFLCNACDKKSMIIPNQNFTELYCTNPNCGKRYLFEDIRRKITNADHLKKIGNLADEGYF